MVLRTWLIIHIYWTLTERGFNLAGLIHSEGFHHGGFPHQGGFDNGPVKQGAVAPGDFFNPGLAGGSGSASGITSILF